MSCGSSWTVMTWSKFVYVYWRVDGAGAGWCGRGAGFADRKNGARKKPHGLIQWSKHILRRHFRSLQTCAPRLAWRRG